MNKNARGTSSGQPPLHPFIAVCTRDDQKMTRGAGLGEVLEQVAFRGAPPRLPPPTSDTNNAHPLSAFVPYFGGWEGRGNQVMTLTFTCAMASGVLLSSSILRYLSVTFFSLSILRSHWPSSVRCRAISLSWRGGWTSGRNRESYHSLGVDSFL